MKKANSVTTIIACICAVALLQLNIAYAQDFVEDSILLAGVVAGKNQFISDKGAAYEISDNSAGDELSELIGARVQIKGKILEMGEKKIILVYSFKILQPGKNQTG